VAATAGEPPGRGRRVLVAWAAMKKIILLVVLAGLTIFAVRKLRTG
jgi:hypothetical protein